MKFLAACWFFLFSSVCAAGIPTSPSVTFGTAAPNPPNASTFNKYDGSVYVQTSDGTSSGQVIAVWHYSIKNNLFVKVPAGSWGSISGLLSSQTDLQTALNGKQATLSLTTTGSGAATLSGATLNVPTPSIPAQFNPTAGAGISISGTYPNMTFTSTSLSTAAQTQLFPLVSNASSTSTTRAPIPGWQFDVTAGKSYRVEIIGTYQTVAPSTGGSLGFVLTSGSGTIHGIIEGKTNTSMSSSTVGQSIYAVNNSAATAGSFITTSGVGIINQPHYIGGSFIFNCTGSGTFQAQWGSEVAASAAQLNAGSVMFLTEF